MVILNEKYIIHLLKVNLKFLVIIESGIFEIKIAEIINEYKVNKCCTIPVKYEDLNFKIFCRNDTTH